MADYECFPLWEASPGAAGDVDPDTLPISRELKAQLMAWAQSYDRTLNRDDPASSGFQDANAEAEFRRIGNELADRLRSELGPDYSVTLWLSQWRELPRGSARRREAP